MVSGSATLTYASGSVNACIVWQKLYNIGMSAIATPTSLLMPTEQDIGVLPMPSELTVAQAAKILDMSEACLEQLLDIGAYEFRQVGNQRLIERDYLMERAERRTRTHAALARMARWDQEMGLE